MNNKAQLNQITVNSLLRLFAANARTLNNVPNPSGKPKFIIKYGPPASGKGSAMVRSIIEKLGDPLNSYININVDDAVEATNLFKNKSRALVNNLAVKPNSKDFNAFLNKASIKEVEKFSKAYTDIRFGKNSKGVDIGMKMDNLLQQAVAAHKNVTFETTGGNGFPSWIWSWLKSNLKDYQIVLIFPTVPFQETWRRYKSRPTKNYMAGGGFRFASTKQQLRQTYRSSYLYMSDALRTGKVDWIDEIYIVGHNTPNPLVVYPKRMNGPRQGQMVRNFLVPYLAGINSNTVVHNPNANRPTLIKKTPIKRALSAPVRARSFARSPLTPR
jgi:hypothetical protein